LHIRRWPIDQIPTDQNELKSWLFNCYKEKDDLIEYFKINQKFPSHISFLKDPTERDKGIQQQLRNSRLFCFSWFFFWIIGLMIWMYYFYLSTPFKIFICTGVVIHVATSFSVFIRRLRNIEPWPNSTTTQSDMDSPEEEKKNN